MADLLKFSQNGYVIVTDEVGTTRNDIIIHVTNDNKKLMLYRNDVGGVKSIRKHFLTGDELFVDNAKERTMTFWGTFCNNSSSAVGARNTDYVFLNKIIEYTEALYENKS